MTCALGFSEQHIIRSSCNGALASGSEGSIQSLARGKPDATTLLCDRVSYSREAGKKTILVKHTFTSRSSRNELATDSTSRTSVNIWRPTHQGRCLPHGVNMHVHTDGRLWNFLNLFSKRCSLLRRNLLLWSMHVSFSNWLITAEISDVVWTLNTQ